MGIMRSINFVSSLVGFFSGVLFSCALWTTDQFSRLVFSVCGGILATVSLTVQDWE